MIPSLIPPVETESQAGCFAGFCRARRASRARHATALNPRGGSPHAASNDPPGPGGSDVGGRGRIGAPWAVPPTGDPRRGWWAARVVVGGAGWRTQGHAPPTGPEPAGRVI